VGNLSGYAYPERRGNHIPIRSAEPADLTRIERECTAVASYVYTLGTAGNRTGVTELSGRTVAYGYDTLYRLTAETITGSLSGVNGSLAYQYDSVGNRKSISSTLPTINTWNYSYDANGKPGTDGTFTMFAASAGYTYPNGVSTTLQYDPLNRLTSLAAQGAQGAVASYQYTLGTSGNRTGVTELSGRTVAYGYDNLYRLTSETIANDLSGMNGAMSYLYDTVGNRQQMSSTLAAIAPGRWNYDANDRITNDQNDADGNIVARAGIANAYDFENHLIQHGYMTFVYDGDGNRVAKTVGGVTTTYLVDTLNPTGYAQVLDELQSNAVARSYTWGLQLVSESQLVAATPPANPWVTSWYGLDGHGSVRYLTNSTGAVTDTYDYDAFGNLMIRPDNSDLSCVAILDIKDKAATCEKRGKLISLAKRHQTYRVSVGKSIAGHGLREPTRGHANQVLRADLFTLPTPTLKIVQVDFSRAILHFHNRQSASWWRSSANDYIALPKRAGHQLRKLYVVLDRGFRSQSLLQQRDNVLNCFPMRFRFVGHNWSRLSMASGKYIQFRPQLRSLMASVRGNGKHLR
jgi:YD repeat-containing protein